MKTSSYLLLFQTILKTYAFQSNIIINENGLEVLECHLGEDKKLRPQILTVTIFEEKLQIPSPIAHKFSDNTDVLAKENEELFIQLFFPFPFKAHEINYGNLAKELIRINKTTLFPGFGLDENNGLIFYRYTFLRPNGVMNKNQFIAILGSILLMIDTFEDEIELIAKSQKK